MEFTELARVVMDTWRQLAPADRAPYEAVAAQEAMQHSRVRHMFLELQHEYKALYQEANQTGPLGAAGPTLSYNLHHPHAKQCILLSNPLHVECKRPVLHCSLAVLQGSAS